jgi:hypothetical protein
MAVLGCRAPVPPLLLWCDPEGEWLELLHAVAASASFELWAIKSAARPV